LPYQKEIKEKYPQKPIVVLTPFSREITVKLNEETLSAIDYIFSWLGNADIILAIIKLIEDKMNVEYDVMRLEYRQYFLWKILSGFIHHTYRKLQAYFPAVKAICPGSIERASGNAKDERKTKILLATNYEEAITLMKSIKTTCLE